MQKHMEKAGNYFEVQVQHFIHYATGTHGTSLKYDEYSHAYTNKLGVPEGLDFVSLISKYPW